MFDFPTDAFGRESGEVLASFKRAFKLVGFLTGHMLNLEPVEHGRHFFYFLQVSNHGRVMGFIFLIYLTHHKLGVGEGFKVLDQS